MNIETFQLAAFVALLLVGSWLFARVLKPRGRFPLRLATALAAAVLIAVVAHRLGFSLYPPLSDDMSFVSASASFAIVLTLLTLAVTFVWEAPPGTAVFCSSSAYLMQSIAMGLDRLVHFSGIMPVSPEEFSSEAAAVPMADIVSLVISALVVYALTYLLLARRLERQSLLEVGNPVMAFAVGLSMLVTIILDLAIKDIAVFDVPFRYLMVLAGSYLAVCAFILVAEFEVIYSQRLRENVATMERTLAEQGRQYELSRDTISAVNRRVHDIRHQVAGSPPIETGFSRLSGRSTYTTAPCARATQRLTWSLPKRASCARTTGSPSRASPTAPPSRASPPPTSTCSLATRLTTRWASRRASGMQSDAPYRWACGSSWAWPWSTSSSMRERGCWSRTGSPRMAALPSRPCAP